MNTGTTGRDPLKQRWSFTPSEITYWSTIGAAVLVTLVVLFVDGLAGQAVGGLAVLLSVLLLLCGMHVGLAMTVAGGLGIWKIVGPGALAVTFEHVGFGEAASWSLSVIPLFVLMGVAMGRFHIIGKFFVAAQNWFGRLPGGLAVATNLTGAGMASASGSSIAISYAIGRTAIPEMLRHGYRPSLATAVVAASGSVGMLIPPSVVLVIYASVAETPVGPQLLSALVPGVLLALGFSAMIVLRCTLDHSLGPPSTRSVGWGERVRSLRGVTPVAVIAVVIIGGMYSGLFTPTEAGAVGALAAVVLGWLFGPDRSVVFLGRTLVACVRECAVVVSSISLLLMGVFVITRMLTLSGVADALTVGLTGLGLSRVTFLLVLVLVFLVLGMFMDGLAIVLLTVPLLLPVIDAFDISALWFGVFMVIVVELAMITPPIGVLTYVVFRTAQNSEVNLGARIGLSEVFRGIGWFVAVAVAMLVFLIFFPEVALWLPESSSAQ
ncbi:TRAP transporter large permease [Pseudonocardia sp. EC080619-01]|uniref:TRAP transporter large permease n=1 Tax=Pseudonocardia sp. EC080619-01 TaxID=1096856 RepID=UPI001D043EDC|nr:TRAP transporter large permease subunit [Pseudonocardia sp. EC080619-01]